MCARAAAGGAAVGQQLRDARTQLLAASSSYTVVVARSAVPQAAPAAGQAAQCTAQPAQGPQAAAASRARVQQRGEQRRWCERAASAAAAAAAARACAACHERRRLEPLPPSSYPCCSASAHTSISCSWQQPAWAPACAQPPTSSGHDGWQAAEQGGPTARPAGGLLSNAVCLFACYLFLHKDLLQRTCRLSCRAWSTVAAAQQQQPEDSSSGGSGGSGSGGSGSSPARRRRGPKSHTEEPQPQLQAWLRQQGVPAAKADQHARRLAHVFGSQQAALDGLPATFEWCRSQGLTGLQATALLDRIARKRHESVVQFAATVQHDWQQIDSCIAACVQAAGGSKRLTHTSLAEKLGSSPDYAESLGMPPGHVEAWLAAVSERLPAPAIGRLLLSSPDVVTASPATALAALGWAADEVEVADPAAFFAVANSLLTYDVVRLQRNLDSLQQALGLSAGQARQLAVKQPRLLSTGTDTVADAVAWLRQHFPAPEQLADVISRAPHLLFRSTEHLQGNADALQRALGWQDGDGQLAAFIAAYPQPFATVEFGSKETEAKLRFLTQVVGADPGDCIAKGSGYLMAALETMAAHYMLALVRRHV